MTAETWQDFTQVSPPGIFATFSRFLGSFILQMMSAGPGVSTFVLVPQLLFNLPHVLTPPAIRAPLARLDRQPSSYQAGIVATFVPLPPTTQTAITTFGIAGDFLTYMYSYWIQIRYPRNFSTYVCSYPLQDQWIPDKGMRNVYLIQIDGAQNFSRILRGRKACPQKTGPGSPPPPKILRHLWGSARVSAGGSAEPFA